MGTSGLGPGHVPPEGQGIYLCSYYTNPPPLTSDSLAQMLYSSSRESLKRGLGFSLFAADYYCNEKGDLSWDAYKRSVSDVSGDPLSEVEQLKKEEAALERDTNTKSSAMGDLPFEILPETTEALAAFAAGGSDRSGVLALSLENEKVNLFCRT